MGLDQYLYASCHVSGYAHNGPQARPFLDKIAEQVLGKPGMIDDGSPHAEVDFAIGYWRKANQIHKWMVDNVQGGKDECQESPVSRGELQTLKGLCERILENQDAGEAAELLPPQAGFFFGSTGIDEWYFDDLQHTVEVIDKALSLPPTISFYYRASW